MAWLNSAAARMGTAPVPMIPAPVGGESTPKAASWFDQQNVAGYSDWLRTERNLEGSPRAFDPATTPPATPGADGPVNAPYAKVDTGGGQYPLSSVAGEGFLRPWTTPFAAPAYDSLGNNDAFKFRMAEGSKAIERAASAKGTLGTARPMKDLMRWGQGLASEEYDKVYNRSLGEYRMAHDIYTGNQGDQWNRLSGMAGTGQSAANTLGSQGSSYAQSGADLITGAGNANAAGQVGAANAWSNGISGIADNAMMLALLRQQQQPYPSTSYPRG